MKHDSSSTGVVRRARDNWAEARTRIFQATSCVIRSRDAAGRFPSSTPAQCGFDEGDAATSGGGGDTDPQGELRIRYAIDSEGAVARANFVVHATSSEHFPLAEELWIDTVGLLMRTRPRPGALPYCDASIGDGVDAIRCWRSAPLSGQAYRR